MPVNRAFVAAILFSACSVVPETTDLDGTWVHASDAQVRAFEFASIIDDPVLDGFTNVYRLYLYDEGSEPTVVQMGQYAVEHDILVNVGGESVERDDVLVTGPLWSSDGIGVGGAFGNAILDFRPGRRILLEVDGADGSQRSYEYGALR